MHYPQEWGRGRSTTIGWLSGTAVGRFELATFKRKQCNVIRLAVAPSLWIYDWCSSTYYPAVLAHHSYPSMIRTTKSPSKRELTVSGTDFQWYSLRIRGNRASLANLGHSWQGQNFWLFRKGAYYHCKHFYFIASRMLSTCLCSTTGVPERSVHSDMSLGWRMTICVVPLDKDSRHLTNKAGKTHVGFPKFCFS